MKYVAIIGSNSKNSLNRILANFLAKRYGSDDLSIDVLSINNLPFYSVDDELTPSPEVVAFKQAVKEADGVIWLTPEYNHSIPGVLKNAIDWLSRVDKVMINKPSLIMGTTPGFLGKVYAQMHLRDILFALQSPVLMGNDTLVGAGHQKLSGADEVTDESTIAWLDTVMPNFKAFVEPH
ncbi:NADPH-dependent FMN reductase [Weissella confusa]